MISFMYGTCSLVSRVQRRIVVSDGCFDNLRESHRESSSLWPEAIFSLSESRLCNYFPKPRYKLLVTITRRVKCRLIEIFPPGVFNRELYKPQTNDGGENVFWKCKFLLPRCLLYCKTEQFVTLLSLSSKWMFTLPCACNAHLSISTWKVYYVRWWNSLFSDKDMWGKLDTP